MRLVSYRLKERQSYRIGFIEEDYVFDLQESYRQYLLSKGQWETLEKVEESLPKEPDIFFSKGEQAFKRATLVYEYIRHKNDPAGRYKREEVILGTPQPDPSKIICVGRNYIAHAEEMKGDIPKFPVLFAKFPNALIGPEDAIEKTPLTNQLDYEVELVVVIGKKAQNVKRNEAYDYVLGYTIGNDVTARDLQKRTLQWLQGKTIDRTTPIGPWIVTKDELPNPDALTISTYVNDELRQHSTTEKFIFDIPYLIEFISHLVTLEPGDLLLTGTPEGVAAGMEEPKFLQVGDKVRLEIEQIGILENTVIDKNKNGWNTTSHA